MKLAIHDAPIPLVEEIPPPDPEQALVRFAKWPRCVFLDSARRDPILGRYSYLSADPFAICQPQQASFAALREAWTPWRSATVAGLPPFQGGVAGLFSYDLNRQHEAIPAPRFDEFQLPAMALGLYDVVVAWDHVANRAWIISHGFPERREDRRLARAQKRLDWFRYLLSREEEPIHRPVVLLPVVAQQLAPQFAVGGLPELTSNFSADDFLRCVERGIEYVCAGDVFQVNLAQRLLYPSRDDSLSLYRRLRARNPATFAAYFDLGQFQVLSASPERLARVHDGRVEARPIKGTRSRRQRPEADLFSADELLSSEKDYAENVMIVDLLRNDLSLACAAESVCVRQLCQLEEYEFVQHLVSVIEGQLRSDQTALDLLRGIFPGGSVTGAPKVRAMEIIAELEPTARGAYCGGLGFLGFDGNADANILIRTITAGRGWWQAPVGGGITAQSDPRREYAETWHKAEGLLRALA